MAFLSKGKKLDLYNLASELRVSVTLEDKIIDLREKITSCTFFQNNEQFVKEMLDNIVDERKSLEIEALKKVEREDKFLADQRAFELEKLKLQAQNPPASVGNSSQMDSNPMRLDLKTVLPTFIPDKDDISLFLTMFERQMKLLNVPADFWVSLLIGVLPSDIGSLIAREPEEMFRNYAHIHNILLQRSKLTADRFRVLLCRHQKQDHSTWKDFFFELRTFFEDYKNHFLDTWEILNDPVVLAEKLDSYENVKPSSQKLTKLSNSRFSRNTGNPEFRKSHSFKVEKNVSGNHNSAFANPSYMPARNTNTGFHPPISCYGCGNPGFIKSKCPKCSQKKESASVNAIHMFTCLTSPVALLDIEVYEATGTVCADTGASQSLGVELMFKFLRNHGQKFSEFHLAMCLADGQQSTSLVQKATVPITVGGRTFQIDLIFFATCKSDKPSFRIPFSKDVPLPVDDSPVEINSSSCPTNSIPSEIPLHSNTVDKTAAIQNIPSPRNLKQLQSFLQTCSCLLSSEHLLQGESPTDEQPVEYASRLLSSAEKNYSTTEREALAIVWALNKFRGYIEGAEITVASDHQTVKVADEFNITNWKISPRARWALQIQSYNLKIDYFPGKCNFIADMLSRPEYRDEEICKLKTIIIDFPTRTANELRTEQLKDLELKKIVDCFENPNKGVDFANWTGRGYMMNQGVLYRYSPHAEVEEAQLVVPTHEREDIKIAP
ncbi:retrovirus-related Pol polyprotein from transposon 412 [Trichonephila clavipes]|nr:retrovirus-related Pol polyprotein from transposon 412 [Trichonephila clavipes]